MSTIIELTEAAAKQINTLRGASEDTPSHLRLLVESGGCSGFEYGITFDSPKEDDTETESSGIKIVIDPASLQKLKGCKIHFDDGLHGKGFEITNPNAESTCGCGKSFN